MVYMMCHLEYIMCSVVTDVHHHAAISSEDETSDGSSESSSVGDDDFDTLTKKELIRELML